ncbi:GDCCVxC domain-containing (seleno)protein [Burkholderia sp. S-53]|uniref:GDCCVxC domain-containing (seleno)protein n=1 Tax=Burkholderia sp. S-53 TaxID=2906514 RepID=UPI00399AD900
MPANACRFCYECRGCHVLLRPRPGDCCVFGSFGSVQCPQQQHGTRCRDCLSTGSSKSGTDISRPISIGKDGR